MIDYAFILTKYYPNKQWSLNGDDYKDLIWIDETAKPSEEELQRWWQDYIDNDQYLTKRKLSYNLHGLSTEAKVEALWEMIINQDSSRVDELKNIIEIVNQQFPAPKKGI